MLTMGKTALARGKGAKIIPFLCKSLPQPEVCCVCFRPGKGLMRLRFLSQSTVWWDYVLISRCLNRSYFLHHMLLKFQTGNRTAGDLLQPASTDIPYLNNSKHWLKMRVFSLKRGQRFLCIFGDFAATQ